MHFICVHNRQTERWGKVRKPSAHQMLHFYRNLPHDQLVIAHMVIVTWSTCIAHMVIVTWPHCIAHMVIVTWPHCIAHMVSVVGEEKPAEVVLSGCVTLPIIAVTILILKCWAVWFKHRALPTLLLKQNQQLLVVLVFTCLISAPSPTSSWTNITLV